MLTTYSINWTLFHCHTLPGGLNDRLWTHLLICHYIRGHSHKCRNPQDLLKSYLIRLIGRGGYCWVIIGRWGKLGQIVFLQKVCLDWSRPVEPSWLIFDCSSKSFKLLLNCFIHLPLQELFKAFLTIRTVMEESVIRGYFAFGLFIYEHFKDGPAIPQWSWK